MNAKEVYKLIMEKVHDEASNCQNLITLMEMHCNYNESSEAIRRYLQARSKAGTVIKELIDLQFLNGERREKS